MILTTLIALRVTLRVLLLKADLDGTTSAYDCRMRFLERALLTSCKK